MAGESVNHVVVLSSTSCIAFHIWGGGGGDVFQCKALKKQKLTNCFLMSAYQKAHLLLKLLYFDSILL